MFKKKKDQKQVVREQKRKIGKSQRELDREIRQLDQQERKVQAECKVLAKKGQMDSAKILAKEIIRIRQQKAKLYQARGHLTGASTRVTTMQSTGQVAKAMGSSAKVMGQMNRQTNVAQMGRTMQEFDKQSQMADMKGEMMDDLFEDPDVDEEADAEVDAVLDGLNLEVLGASSTPSSALPSGEQQSDVSDADIEKFLAGLSA